MIGTGLSLFAPRPRSAGGVIVGPPPAIWLIKPGAQSATAIIFPAAPETPVVSVGDMSAVVEN